MHYNWNVLLRTCASPNEKCEICWWGCKNACNIKIVFLTKSLYSQSDDAFFSCCFLFLATPSKHKAYMLCLQNVLPYICEMILKKLTNIKTSDLRIIAIIFLVVFEFSFSQYFEIQNCKIIYQIFLRNSFTLWVKDMYMIN